MPGDIAYLDASALVKRYVAEPGTEAVQTLLARVAVTGTAAITQVEVAAALAKAVRMGVLPRDEAASALERFLTEWQALERLQVTEPVLSQASDLAWEKGLRGYDATHLAAALIWQELLGAPVLLATFDRQLWEAAQTAGLAVWPDALS
jgi:predicted nucleic acid-binding protein